jgi:hypothetical protein
MNEPVTTIDKRYSDPEAAATPWEETRCVLETAEVWATKWDGRFQFQASDGYFHDPNVPESVLVFSVTPKKVFAFGRGHQHDAHTRHQF